MTSIIIAGIIVFAGFILGEAVSLVRLPRITGYILAGLLLNPEITGIIPAGFPQHTQLITDVALAFITFSVGGTLLWAEVKKLGRVIVGISLLEAGGAFVFIAVGFSLLLSLTGQASPGPFLSVVLPLALLAGALGAPTDPSATLAVKHEFHADGEVSRTILGIAAFDDGIALTIYGVVTAVVAALVSAGGFHALTLGRELAGGLLGSVAIGGAFGLVFNVVTRLVPRETEGMLIVLIMGLLMLCYGVARLLGVDELMATMAMGVVVVNFNPLHDKIFAILERYTEELVFVFFFVISGMKLHVAALGTSLPLIGAFVLLRVAGKFCGTWLGAALTGASGKISRYTAFGLIPQGGIVIGMALTVERYLNVPAAGQLLINIVLGSTVIHELIGPVTSRVALSRAQELNPSELPG